MDIHSIKEPAGTIPAKHQRPSKEATELEAVFLGMVVNEMLKDTTPKTMNGGHGEEMFRSFLGHEIGAVMAQTGGIGLAREFDKTLGIAE